VVDEWSTPYTWLDTSCSSGLAYKRRPLPKKNRGRQVKLEEP